MYNVSCAHANPLEFYKKITFVGRGAFGVCHVYRKPRDNNGPPTKVIVKTISIEGYSEKEQEALKGIIILKCLILKILRGSAFTSSTKTSKYH